MNRSFRRALHVLSMLSFLGPLLPAAPAAAQDIATATALFNRGRAHMDEGRYDIACNEIAESLRIDPRAGTLFTLAVCESSAGRVATAMARFDEYLRLYDRLAPEQQAQQRERQKVAKEEREKLARDVPELTLLLPPGAPAGTVVKRNGEVVGGVVLGVALPVDPGQHVVSTQAPGGPVWEQQITIGKGEKQRVVLDVRTAHVAPATQALPPKPAASRPQGSASPGPRKAAAPPRKPAALPPAGDERPSSRRIAAYAVGGVGLAGFVVGGVTGGLALGKKRVIEDHCGGGIGSADKAVCDTTGFDASQSIKTLGLISTIGFVAGIAGTGTAIVLLWTAPKQARHVAGAGPHWVGAGVLSAAPQGALLGAKGVW